MRAAIYARVSRDGSGTGRSVDEQIAEAREWVRREGWTEVGVWKDVDRSASRYAKKDRNEWQALTARLDRGEAGILVVWEPSRATRDRRVWAALAATCEEQGIRIGASGRVYDLEDPDDAFQLDLFFALASRESGTTRKRVLRAARANAAAGRPHGKLLFGYRREYAESPRGPVLLAQHVHDEQAAVVREAARRVARGEPLYAVTRDFNARGICGPRGGTWDPTQVKRLCTNPSYIAKRTHRGAVVGDAAWPPILDEETYYTCVRRLTDPRRKTVRDGAKRHLLTGIARCGVCGEPVVKQKNRGFDAYLCRAGFCVSRKQADVDELVAGVIVARLARPDALAVLAGPAETDEARTAAAEAAEKKVRLEGFYDAAAGGELTPAALARVEARLLPEIAVAEERSRRATVAPVLREVAREDIAERWDELPITVRREVVDLLVRVRIMPTGRGRRTFDPKSVQLEWRMA